MKMSCFKKGDIVLVNLSPVMGHEQKGQRPALVITDESFNKETGFCWIVPITSVQKNYPFEVVIESSKTSGVILADQIRSIDWKARKVKKIDKVSKGCLDEVLNLIKLILE